MFQTSTARRRSRTYTQTGPLWCRHQWRRINIQTLVKLTLPKTLRPRRTDHTTCLDPSLYRIPSASLSRSKVNEHTISLIDASFERESRANLKSCFLDTALNVEPMMKCMGLDDGECARYRGEWGDWTLHWFRRWGSPGRGWKIMFFRVMSVGICGGCGHLSGVVTGVWAIHKK